MEAHSHGMDEFRGAVVRLDHRLDALAGRVDALDLKIDRYREELVQRFDSRLDRVDVRLDGMDLKLTRMFTWTVGMHVTVLLVVVGALLRLTG